jgi:two-component system, OmpR family, KDP operon response regulator KdpE
MTAQFAQGAAPLLLLIEDEEAVRKFLRLALATDGFRVVEAVTAEEGLLQAKAHNPDLVLLDLGLPDLDGVVVTRRLREWTQTPIIIISARGNEEDKVTALDAGADDYLTKPFGKGELMARMRAALRRAARIPGEPNDGIMTIGELRLDAVRREVSVDGRSVHLTPIEYKLLSTLMKNAGKVMTHRQLLAEVWGPLHAEETQYLRVYMSNLRQKLERDAARPKYLLTDPGVGYRIKD